MVKQATGAIPIVFFDVGDPVGVGLAASLAAPGGNVAMSVEVKSPMTPQSYVKAIYVLSDKNPRPLNPRSKCSNDIWSGRPTNEIACH